MCSEELAQSLGHSYTYATYANSGYYDPQVTSYIADSDDNVLDSQTVLGRSNASALLFANGTGCGEYRIVSSHSAVVQYYTTAYFYNNEYRDGYYDLFDYLQFAEQGQSYPLPISFFAPAVSSVRIHDYSEIVLGYTENTSSGNCEPPCAYPTNFRQVGAGRDSGAGTLSFTYKWDSSTGRLADLSACTIGEIVTYPSSDNPYIPPGPPWNVGYPNPTIINVPNPTLGTFDDNHRAPSFVTPYSSSSYTATQYYRYKCPCTNNGNFVNLLGPMSIVRSMSPSTGGNWKYTVTKSGASVTIDPLPPNGSP